MVAPLRPSITPSIWALCAAATPHSSTSAASDRVTTKAILAVLLRFIILFSYSFSCRCHLLESWVDWGKTSATCRLDPRPPARARDRNRLHVGIRAVPEPVSSARWKRWASAQRVRGLPIQGLQPWDTPTVNLH